jgi:hypothetical protein
VNTRGFSSFLDYYNAVDGYMGYIFAAGLRFTPKEPGPNSVIFVLSMGGVSAASQANIWS